LLLAVAQWGEQTAHDSNAKGSITAAVTSSTTSWWIEVLIAMDLVSTSVAVSVNTKIKVEKSL
jgi:hypothetical protein